MDALKNVDALICVGKFSKDEISRFRTITSSIIFLDMPVDDATVSTITLDFANAMATGLDYLTALGHTRIGFLGGNTLPTANCSQMHARRFSLIIAKRMGWTMSHILWKNLLQ
jgi:DNA-binding LacI/PurR family transcriptional regulator